YMESAASGILAGINAVRLLKNQETLILPRFSMIGALLNYICDQSVSNFQPMGANFGILPSLDTHIKDKKERYAALANRSLAWFDKNL
ncbi:MAG: methylenetetrahydrofolate--tRNA-(uracil(54)-C(5))-methyltransferase (FADH(2)-oxidizing) TrmFO, partial [Clostridia bacterium]|nr:methylenetetrahydrofolate--tRNA-(uracil(54)-C(5))-methyltransferase (FADH(2)-oxidizing) TrmFO [Clostridia bacterium]